MLAESTRDLSVVVADKAYCCVRCSPTVRALDKVHSEVTRIATAHEAVTGRHVDEPDPIGSPHPESVPTTPQLPRSRRWWLSVNSGSDDE